MNVRVKNKLKAAARDRLDSYRQHRNRTEKSKHGKNIRESLDKFTWEQHSVGETLQVQPGNNWDGFQTFGVDVGTTELSDNWCSAAVRRRARSPGML